MLVPATNETQRAFGVARTVCASCATMLRGEELTHALTIILLLGELAHALGVRASHVEDHGRCAAISSIYIIIIIVVLSSHLPYNIISTSHLLGLHDIPSRCLVCTSKHVTRRRPQRARGERLRMYPPRPRSGQRTNTRGGRCHPLADTGDTRRVRR